MAQSHIVSGADVSPASLRVRKIELADLFDALRRGYADFMAMPSHAAFLCLIYPVMAIVLWRLTVGYDVLSLLFPLAAGFALIGPLAALGLYELSRQREQGRDVSWRDAFDVFHSPSIGAIAALGAVLLILFFVWLAVAQAIYVATFGYVPAASIPSFISQILTTAAGWKLIILGNGIGFLFAVLALSISVVSFPLLVDRDVGAAVAIATSVRAVVANPITMALWGLIVAVLLFLGSLPLFLGLPVVLPVLGHATWHLYRKVVDAEQVPRAEIRPEPTEHRSAANFPAALFPAKEEPPKH